MKLLDTTTKVIDNVSMTITPIQDVDGNLYFLPKEIEKALDYNDLARSIDNSNGFLENIDYIICEGEKLADLKEISKRSNTTFAPNINSIRLLTESGLYAVLLKSRKPLAQKFRVWVTSEVLPSIRRTGSYNINQDSDNWFYDVPQEILDNDPMLISTKKVVELTENYIRLKYHQEKMRETQKTHGKQIIELQAKTQSMIDRTGYYSILAWAKINEKKITNNQAKKLGKLATKFSKKRNIPIGTVPDERYGRINTYHKDILEELIGYFGEDDYNLF